MAAVALFTKRFDCAYVDTLIAVNSADATGRLSERYLDPEQQARERARMPPYEHPVIRVHPDTGRKQIFVSESYTTSIKGVSRNALVDTGSITASHMGR
jgi:taurine dioxygenase